MTLGELRTREKIVLDTYKERKNVKTVQDEHKKFLNDYKRNKFFRFRPSRMYEVDAVKTGQIYLCRPTCYDDLGDCDWIDDLEDLIIHMEVEKADEVQQKGQQINSSLRITPERSSIEDAKRIREHPKYKAMQEKMRRQCLVACITDKMTSYMWKEYAVDSEGICLEYDIAPVFFKASEMQCAFGPVRYVTKRKELKDIQFNLDDYMDDSQERMINKYYLSCMTKEKFPYAKESEWRLFWEYADIPEDQNGRSFEFIRPSKIYLGKNIDRNIKFKEGILNVAKEYGIPVEQE